MTQQSADSVHAVFWQLKTDMRHIASLHDHFNQKSQMASLLLASPSRN